MHTPRVTYGFTLLDSWSDNNSNNSDIEVIQDVGQQKFETLAL